MSTLPTSAVWSANLVSAGRSGIGRPHLGREQGGAVLLIVDRLYGCTQSSDSYSLQSGGVWLEQRGRLKCGMQGESMRDSEGSAGLSQDSLRMTSQTPENGMQNDTGGTAPYGCMLVYDRARWPPLQPSAASASFQSPR